MVNESLQPVFGIDPKRFNQTFAEYWQDKDSSENRVHVETIVEREVIDAVDEWSNRIYQEAQSDDQNTGLFLIIEGAQATGKTAMTRYIRDQLDPLENTSRQNLPIVLPIWQKSDSNPSSYKYLQQLQDEGEEYLKELENVPDLDKKLQLLEQISTQLSEEELSALTDGTDISGTQFQKLAEQAGFFEGEMNPSDVVSELTSKGYTFVFIFDEMVPSHAKEEAQNVLKWFEKHLNPHVGFVLFCHPDISSITRDDMFDQMRRRNGDITLDIAGTEHRLDENHIINIRGRQDELIDLRQLLNEYFDDVYLDEPEEKYGPFTEANLEWMNSLLGAHGLIGNLIDGVGSAMKRYAKDANESNEYGNIGAYLYDECDRAMKSARLKTAFRSVSSLDPDDRTEDVAIAKELIVGSRSVDELTNKQKETLEDALVLYEDDGDLKIHPKLLDPNFGTSDSDIESDSRERLIDEYLRKAEEFESELEDADRDELRHDIEDALIDVIEWFGTQRANITDRSTLSVPGLDRPTFAETTFSRVETGGQAEKIQPSSGGLEQYEGEFLTFVLFKDESLADSGIKSKIQDLYNKDYRDSGVFVFTDEPPENWENPDWLTDQISTHRQWTPDYTWGDVVERVYVPNLQEPRTISRICDNRNYETVVDRISAIQALSEDHLAPDLYGNFIQLASQLHEGAINLQDNIYQKYDGPTLPEAKALKEVKKLVEEHGFITVDDLIGLRGDYRHELEALIDSGGLKEIEGTGDTFVFLADEYGGISHLTGRSVDDLRNLRPIPVPVLEELEEIAEMQEDLQSVYQNQDIKDALTELEEAESLINYFVTKDKKLEQLTEEMTDISSLTPVRDDMVSVVDDFNYDAYSRITPMLDTDRKIWNEIQELEDADISDIHRTLFYARLVEKTPDAAEEYLDDDEYYPYLLYESEEQIRDVLVQLQNKESEKVSSYESQTESLTEKRREVRTFAEGGDSDE